MRELSEKSFCYLKYLTYVQQRSQFLGLEFEETVGKHSLAAS